MANAIWPDSPAGPILLDGASYGAHAKGNYAQEALAWPMAWDVKGRAAADWGPIGIPPLVQVALVCIPGLLTPGGLSLRFSDGTTV